MFVKNPGLPEPKSNHGVPRHIDPFAIDVITEQPSLEDDQPSQQEKCGGGWQEGTMS